MNQTGTCYRPMTDGSMQPFGGMTFCTKYQSASGFSSCCFPPDECLEDGLCYATRNVSGSVGYYVGGCSDPTYKDSACNQHCTDLTKGDIIYNEDTSRWSCCGADGNGNPNCENPTTQTFSAPAPSALLAEATATSRTTSSSSTTISSATSSATSSVTSSATPSATTSSTPSSDHSSGLSTGAKAGIGVGVAVGVIAALVLFSWFFMRKSRRHHHQNQTMNDSKEPMRSGQQMNYNPYASEAPAIPAYSPHHSSGSAKHDYAPGQVHSQAELESAQPVTPGHYHELA